MPISLTKSSLHFPVDLRPQSFIEQSSSLWLMQQDEPLSPLQSIAGTSLASLTLASLTMHSAYSYIDDENGWLAVVLIFEDDREAYLRSCTTASIPDDASADVDFRVLEIDREATAVLRLYAACLEHLQTTFNTDSIARTT
jgi:hypothetical protein